MPPRASNIDERLVWARRNGKIAYRDPGAVNREVEAPQLSSSFLNLRADARNNPRDNQSAQLGSIRANFAASGYRLSRARN